MSDELRTNFTDDERNAVICHLRDEYGKHDFSEELVLLECQDMWRKGCHNFASSGECHGCGSARDCPMIDWEKRHPEYKDDALAKRLKELRDELNAKATAEIEKKLLAKGYVKVQLKQQNEEFIESKPRLYLPGSKELKADLLDAIANWKYMWGARNFRLDTIDLDTKEGVILSLKVNDGDEYEIWEIV